jgi:hypothetical protein
VSSAYKLYFSLFKFLAIYSDSKLMHGNEERPDDDLDKQELFNVYTS